MTDYTDLCKRLRDIRVTHSESAFATSITHDAADAIEALQAELKRSEALQAEVEALRADAEKWRIACMVELEAERDDLIRENEALHDVHDLLLAANARAERAEAENADMKSRWMDWCDSHALDRIEALQADNAHWQDRALGMQTERDALRVDAERWRFWISDSRRTVGLSKEYWNKWADENIALAAQEKKP